MPRLRPSMLAVLLGALLLSSAIPAVAQQPEDNLTRIKRTGVFTIGYRESSPPFSFVTKTDPKPQGYSIDLCLRVAEGIKKDLGLGQLDVKFVKVTPEDRINAVNSGTVDIECGSTTKTPAAWPRSNSTCPPS